MNQFFDELSVLAFLKAIPLTIRYLLLGVFINQLGYFIQAYLIVFMLTRGFSLIEAAWGLAVLSSGAIIGTLVGSAFSTHIGNRNTIVLSTLAMGISVALLPWLVDDSIPMVVWVGSIFVCGFFTQMYRPAAATMLSHHMPETRHVMGFSMFRITLNLGGVIGPLLATLLASIDWSLVFWLNALCSFCYAGVALIKLPNDPSTCVSKADHAQTIVGSWSRLFNDTKFWAFLWAMFLSSIVFIQFTSTVPVAIKTQGFSLSSYSTLLTVYAAILITCELKISAIVSRFSAWIPATIGTTLLCLGIASFGLTFTSKWGMIFSAVIFVGGLMISGPTMFAYPAKFPPLVRGKYIGMTQAVFSAGNALGPMIGIFIFREFHSFIWIFCMILAFVSGTLVMVGMRSTTKTSSYSRVGVTD